MMNKSTSKSPSISKYHHLKDISIAPTQATSLSPKYKERFTSTSPNNIKKSYSPGFKTLEERYKQLQSSFAGILQKTKERNIQYQKQKKELQRYKIIHEKDKRQIHKLRGMLGFLPKQDKQIQCNMDSVNSSTLHNTSLKSLKISKITKLQSTATNIFRGSQQSWYSPYSPYSPSKQISRDEQNINILKLNDQNQGQIDWSKNLKIQHRKLSNSPYSKYRFRSKLNNNV